jgi:LPS-assembly lipoprotein
MSAAWMGAARQALGVVLACGFLTACGFQPVYRQAPQAGATGDALSAIAIAPIAGGRVDGSARTGHLLRNALIDQFNPRDLRGGAARYRLVITLEDTREAQGIRADEAVTRMQLRLRARYRLIAVQGEAVLTSGDVRALAAYDVVTSDFANVAASRQAEQHAAQLLAIDLRRRLSGFFHSRLAQERATPKRAKREKTP